MSAHEEAKEILVDVIALSQHCCETSIAGKLAYAGIENFVGRVIDGYSPEACDVILLARQAAEALCQVQNALNVQGMGLYIFDAYRPLRAVKDFATWFRAPVANAYETERQRIHYPQLTKPDLVAQGYIPDTVSHHNFGRAVDLTLIVTARTYKFTGSHSSQKMGSHYLTLSENLGSH